MVVVVSVVGAAVFAVGFFSAFRVARRRSIARRVAVPASIVSALVVWAVTIVGGRLLGSVTSGESVVHHVYVLAVVGVPLMGLALALHLWVSPRSGDLGRRLGWAASGLLLVPATIGVWGTHVEPERLRVDRVDLDPGPAAADQASAAIRIGVVADVQTDNFGDYERRAIEMMLAEDPDIIFVAGDITQLLWDDYLAIRADGVEVLSLLEAPSGVVSIQGNTDPGPLEFAAFSKDSGMTPLLDEVLELDVRGRRLRIAGPAWPNYQRAEAQAFVRSFVDSSTPGVIDVLLAYSPDAVLNVADASALDLVVSGHTHGGQVSIPLFGPIWNQTDVPRNVAGGGLHDVRGAPVYVSTGVGLQRGDAPKVRFLVRPSIGVITIP